MYTSHVVLYMFVNRHLCTYIATYQYNIIQLCTYLLYEKYIE